MTPRELNKINMGTSPQSAAQDFTRKQIYTKGFTYNVEAGAGNIFNPNLGGKARFLYGICVYSEDKFQNDLDLFSLTINSEVIADKVIWVTYNPQQATGNVDKAEQFFALPRLLSGSDSVEILYNSDQAHKLNIVFYLSDVRP